jgi:mono/diheme cytochrome c family protein
LRPGLPNHQFDLGKAKGASLNALGLYSTWGPGRVDISADGRDNPISIADVRAIRFQTYLHRTANVKNSLVMLALRIETGLITAHRGAVRPTPKDAFALAYYLWSLGAEFNLEAPMHHPGRATFSKHCASCHQGVGHSGLPVTPEAIHSPVAMKPSPDRGTGTVQTLSLLGVSGRQRLLFGGEADSVHALLDPNRTEGGHYVGRQLSEDERRTIEAYLESL